LNSKTSGTTGIFAAETREDPLQLGNSKYVFAEECALDLDSLQDSWDPVKMVFSSCSVSCFQTHTGLQAVIFCSRHPSRMACMIVRDARPERQEENPG
jgi:hypothetical protein